jgi:hypothetical protein
MNNFADKIVKQKKDKNVKLFSHIGLAPFQCCAVLSSKQPSLGPGP